ncbi:DapH/DapD/GlmU-related protein [Rhodococcus sp. CSLK01-03]|uniref:DapH/DapD/GlmU-related protein n=1 Tax=Rhodococcus indonesiensis TaxID=3055869 RepID=A0ABT7RS95_9NOCA|nr:DapH/DapD/GlmU-related protein [Rhodococcus indonesiensis]MDM7490520.1 DapH/DapD/GlmU-related protein [Rhodococcus indonesiensis]
MSKNPARLEWPQMKTVGSYIIADFRANPRDPKAQVVMVLFRLCQVAMGRRNAPRKISYPLVAFYRLFTELLLGLELRPKTVVGAGLSIYHGFGLVVNDHCIIGRNVALRNGVTIGNRIPGGPVPVIGDNVEIGAGAIVLGEVHLGDDCKVGAGSVVLHSVPDNAVVVGNPARIVVATSNLGEQAVTNTT